MAIDVLRDAQLETRWRALDALLASHAQFWKSHAFTALQQPWEVNAPELAAWLRALPLEQSEALARDHAGLAAALARFIPAAAEIGSQCAVGAFDTQPQFAAMAPARDVPGRKWQQITAFAAALTHDVGPTLEWCAGKAHLGRLLARCGCAAVETLEWDAALVAEAERLAQREQLALTSHLVDVMSPQAANLIRPRQRVIALHACGDLHSRMLHACTQRKPIAVALAPCCYQLTQQQHYAPMSACAHAGDVALTRDDLRTAVHGTATSPTRVQRQRRELQAWRLGFDLLQRECRGFDAYLPTPSLPLSVLRAGFTQFCQRLAAHSEIVLPEAVNYAAYAAAGAERLRLVTALDLPRVLFRRALELWLVLDRALLMREAGYTVEVGTFCAAALTPRNLLLQARRIDTA